jgi:hypothetical protein
MQEDVEADERRPYTHIMLQSMPYSCEHQEPHSRVNSILVVIYSFCVVAFYRCVRAILDE